MNHDYFALCVRVEDLKDPTLGSVKDICSHCGEDVWVGPNQLVNDVARNSPRLCLGCAFQHLSKIALPNTVYVEFL